MTLSEMTTRTVRAALLCGAAAVAIPVAAQAQSAPDTSASKVEEIVVTGTRVRTPGLVANSPVVSVGEFQVNQQQPAAVEALIKDLPGAIPSIGSATNNGSGGAALISMRGLQSIRTLTLVDGRRITPYNLNGNVDTNIIPVALIERIDLVTGGASAVYGADAITGVVNFILKRDFEGIQVSSTYGVSDRSDARRRRHDVTVGGNFDNGKGNVVLSAGRTKTDPLRYDARAWGRDTLRSQTGLPSGSDTTVPARITINPVTGGAPLGARQVDPATGRLVPTYNTFFTNPDNLYQTPLDRNMLTALARYEIAPFAEFYANAIFADSDVSTQLAASGTFTGTYNVPIGNPFIPQQMREQICAARLIPAAQCVAGSDVEVPMTIDRRFTELGPRFNTFDNTYYHVTAGFRGDIIDNWTYDANYMYGQVDVYARRVNWGSNSRVQQALRALNTTNCTSTANGCVPLNLFGAEGSITPAMLNFINLSATVGTFVEQEVASGSVSGDLGSFQSPLAGQPIGVAAGVEFRQSTARNASDQPSQINGEVLGTGAPTPDASGRFELTEFYAETIAPLVADKPFVHSLNFEGGIRFSRFQAQETTEYTSYKIGGDWSPVEDVRLRAMFQKATRSPNINELFAPRVTQLSTLAVDPCAGTNINAAQANTAGTLANLCRLTGVPVNLMGSVSQPSSGQVNVLVGGNPSLRPEIANTWTLGFVLQPRFVDNLTITLDHYQIKVNRAISTPAVADIFNGCYNTARNPNLVVNDFCSLINRNPNTGTLNGPEARGVVLTRSNFGMYDTHGFDLGVRYNFDLADVGLAAELGSVALSFDGTQVTRLFYQANSVAQRRDCLGYYSQACGTNFDAPIPEYKWQARATWSVSDFDIGVAWRHIGELAVEPDSGTWFPAYTSIPAYDYLDLSLGYSYGEHLRLNLSVTNVLDKAPPVVGNTIGAGAQNQGNTFPQTYDAIGRYYTVGVTVKF